MQAKVSAGQVIHDDCFTPERHVRRKKQMSALGQKRTSRVATRSSVFGDARSLRKKLRARAQLFLNKLTGKYSERRPRFSVSVAFGGRGEMNMKKLIISTLATALVVSLAVSAEAAGNKQRVSADVQASCKAQAAKKYSAIHFMKRRTFVNNCVAQHAKASAPKTAKPATTGQAPKQ
jgi:hypothetical protein